MAEKTGLPWIAIRLDRAGIQPQVGLFGDVGKGLEVCRHSPRGSPHRGVLNLNDSQQSPYITVLRKMWFMLPIFQNSDVENL